MFTSVIAKLMVWWMLAPIAGTQAQPAQSTHSPHGNLNIACQNCHTVYGWKPIRAVPEFDHNTTKYPLRGLHEGVACTACHTKMVFSNVGNKCADCHADLHKGQLGAACENCHTVRGWKVTVAQINQHMNRFPLTGAHAAATCDQCHKSGALSAFKTMSTDCYSCHQADYKGAKNPNHQANSNIFPVTCENCHSTDSWLNARFDHNTTGFPLTGSHTVPPRQCADCHTNNNYNLTSTACFSCHQQDFDGAKNPNHIQQGFATTCESCHTTVAWSPANFDHNKTAFPLTGQHTVPPRACTDCHVNNNFQITNTSCVSCHLTDFNNTNNPNHVQGGFPQACETCHTTAGWSPASFDHSKTAFPLTGQHTVPPRQCVDCHVNNNYNLTTTTCVSCHQQDYNNAKTPVDHPGGNFPTTCQNCHDTQAWTDATFDHAQTGWPLTGSHTVPPRTCADCHKNGNYNIQVTTCVSCHQQDYNGTNNPPHAAQGMPTTCEICHTTQAWDPAQFDHSKSGFPLTGSHTVPPRQCTDCHVNNNYNIQVTTCVSCHQQDYNNARTPVDHPGANFPTTCANCHDTVQWTDGKFDHGSTGWPLTGSHTVPPRACIDCHIGGNYNIKSTTCVSCHQTDYNNAKSPVDHPGANFPTTCETCHDTIQWTDGKFDHGSTGWPLTGSHTVPPRACVDCHINGNYNIKVTTCVSCHQTDYNNAKTPVDHPGANFPLTCDGCHDTIQWSDGKFDHTQTGFQLTGSHTVPPRACVDCHINGNYNIKVTTCVSCHQTDYNNAKTPVDHVTAQFPTTCETCHDTIQWTDGKFDHSQTGWQLTGSHTVPPRACVDCHTNGNYNIKVTTCVSCHQTDYNNTNDPVHSQVGFPTTCEVCHDTVQWSDGTFDHSKTAFPLTGSHTVPPRKCVDCHVNNNYTTLPTDCYGCHATDYNNTNNPVHSAAHFPTTCATCHDTKVWTDAQFNHTYFPLNHGNANGVCSTCHTNPNDYSVFQCTNCHLKPQMDSTHQGINGYVYNSVNCYNCHKNGGGG